MRRFTQVFVIILTVASWAVATDATARTPSKIKFEDTMRVLKHHGDPTLENFREVGPDVDSALVDLMTRPRLNTELRIRAARSLGWFRNQRAESALVSMVMDKDAPVTVRDAAMIGLARCKGSGAVSTIIPFIKAQEPGLRLGAAVALLETGAGEAEGLIVQAIDGETVLEVRMGMEKALDVSKSDKDK